MVLGTYLPGIPGEITCSSETRSEQRKNSDYLAIECHLFPLIPLIGELENFRIIITPTWIRFLFRHPPQNLTWGSHTLDSGSFLVGSFWSFCIFSGIIHIILLDFIFSSSQPLFIRIYLSFSLPWILESLNPWISVATGLCCLPCQILPSLESLPTMVSSRQNFPWRFSPTLIMPNGRTLLGISTRWY